MKKDIMQLSESQVRLLGLSEYSKGFYYLIYASVFASQIGLRKICLNKEIYDRIASMYKVSPQSVTGKLLLQNGLESWEDGKIILRKDLLCD